MKIFLAHAKEDETITEELYEKLQQNGYTPWMDIKDIPAGVNWEFEIQKNFSTANIIILILSAISIEKNGYIRREINEALEKLKYHKPDDIIVIPLLVDDSKVPNYIASKIQFIDFKRADSWDKLFRSLRLAASQQNIEISQGIAYGPFTFSSNAFKEEYHEMPGHDIEIAYPKIESHTLTKTANILNHYFEGRAANIILSQRTSLWPDRWEWNKDHPGSYISSYSEGYNIAFCNEHIISILHGIYWYGAGAAHPNSDYFVSNFIVNENDYATVFNLEDLFIKGTAQEAIKQIKNKIISESAREFWERAGEKPSDEVLEWLHTGISDSPLQIFTINENGLTFHFAPYQISCYALGSWEFQISFYEVIDYLNPDGIYSMLKKQ